MTEPEHIVGWFTDSAELEVRPGGEGRFGWHVGSTKREVAVNLRIERLDPPRFFSFRWGHPDGDDPTETNSTLVEFGLEDLVARHACVSSRAVSNAVSRSDEARETFFAEHTSGWTRDRRASP